MELAINITLVTLGAVGALTAIGGETWRQNESHFWRKITRRGWLAVFCLILTLILSVVKEIRSDAAAERAEQSQAKLQNDLLTAYQQLEDANQKLQEMKKQIIRIEPALQQAMYSLTETQVDYLQNQFTELQREIIEKNSQIEILLNNKLSKAEEEKKVSTPLQHEFNLADLFRPKPQDAKAQSQVDSTYIKNQKALQENQKALEELQKTLAEIEKKLEKRKN